MSESERRRGGLHIPFLRLPLPNPLAWLPRPRLGKHRRRNLVTASASGLDPDLSPAAAFYQIPRIAHVRGVSEEKLRILVGLLVEKRSYGILGEPRVNLLKLNLALDEMTRTE